MMVTEAIGVNVNVDLLDSTLFDVARMDGIYKLLLWAAAQGRIRNLVGGPPRRSYLAEDVNKRDKEEDLLARFLILGMVAFEGRRQRRSEKVGIAIEHPDYESSSGTFWQSSMWREFASCYGLEVIKSMRGSTGTNLDLGGLSNVASTTTSAGSWTEDYARCVAAAMNAWNGYPLGESVLCSVSVSEDGIKLGKMTAKEWQLHIRRDHIPYRKDCRHCVQSAAGRPHRKTAHRSAYVLSADVAGPFRTQGMNTETNQNKFMLVCAYQFPRLPETLPAQEELEKEDTGAGVGELFWDDADDEGEASGLVLEEAEDISGDAEQSEEKIKEPEGSEEISKEEREAKEASEPFEFSVAYFVRPLRSRRSGDVLRALQEVYIDVKMLGLPVNRLHADRAREFRTPAVAEWAASRDVQITRTEGDMPAQNGVAEQAVKYIKSRTRILLSSAQELSGRDVKEVKTWWPMAAETVAARQRCLAFGQTSNPPSGFGDKVYVKRKKYGAEAKDLDARWSEATYLGPARDVPGGHVVLTKDNHLWNTCNVRQLPEVPMEPDPASAPSRRRIFGKRPPPPVVPLALGRATLLALQKKREFRAGPCELVHIQDKKSVAKMEFLPARDLEKTLSQIALEKQWFSLEDCLSIVEDIPFKRPNQTRVADAWGDPGPDVYVAFGAYQHGGFVGVTKATQEYDHLTRYLVKFLKIHAGISDPFSSIVLAKNLGTSLHRDKYNIDGRRNVVVTFGPCEDGGLWVEGEHGDYPQQSQRLSDGTEVIGTVLPTKDCVTKFDPRRLHCSIPWTGTKWSVIGYCNRGVNRMSSEMLQELREYGFPLPEPPKPSLLQLRSENDFEEYDYCETSDEEEHFPKPAATDVELVGLRKLLDEEEIIESWVKKALDQEEQDAISHANVSAMRRYERLEAGVEGQLREDTPVDSIQWLQLCRLVEGGEQHGIEEVLRGLETPLQVAYTFTLAEVKENIGAWKKAIMKEVQALISCGALTRLSPEEEDHLNRTGALVVLPAKGVFTVKPPDQAITEQTKSSDQPGSYSGVQTKSSDQPGSYSGVQTKSSDQPGSYKGVQTTPSDQEASRGSPKRKRGTWWLSFFTNERLGW